MNKKLKDLLIRTLSALLYGGVFIGGIYLAKWSVGVLFALIAVVCVVEFYNLCRKAGSQPMTVMGASMTLAIFGVAFVLFNQWGVGATDLTSRIIFGLALYAMLMVPSVFVCELWRKSATPINNIATTFMGVVYVALPMSLLLFIPQMLVKGGCYANTLMAYLLIIWANDIFAYLVGVSIGKHRLCERISPKKSWEGFIGGLVGAIGVAVLMGYHFEGNLYVWGGLGVVLSLTGVAGDLVESLLKRSADVKDSGKVMPGHGGLLDRFDALLMSVPFAFIYLLIVGLLN